MTIFPDYTKLIGMIWLSLKPIEQRIPDALSYYSKKYQDKPVMVEVNTSVFDALPKDFDVGIPIHPSKDCLLYQTVVWSKLDDSILQQSNP